MSALRAEVDTGSEAMEDLESFRHRARAFITANLAPKTMEEMRLAYSVGDAEGCQSAAIFSLYAAPAGGFYEYSHEEGTKVAAPTLDELIGQVAAAYVEP